MSLSYVSASQWVWVVSQVFGGCCSNVFVLENMISNHHGAAGGHEQSLASAITFAQFLGVSLVSYRHSANFRTGKWYRLYLTPSKVPLRKWVVLVVMYFSISLLNNWVLRFNVSIPMYIVFRSSGTVVTMIVGYLFGGRVYSLQQVVACIIISLGAICNTLPNDMSKFWDRSTKNDPSHSIDTDFLIGIALLLATSVLSAFMGLYSENVHRRFGNQWRESLFYSHFLGLPLFGVVWPSLRRQFHDIWNDPQVYPSVQFLPKQAVNLLANVLTQYICIRGVNILVGSTTALTVTVVLLVRKFFSLFISIVWFKNEFTTNNMVGSIMVLGGAALYSISRKVKETSVPNTGSSVKSNEPSPTIDSTSKSKE
ncbi:UDP-N-acetylglucosamine transporter Yea4p [[Candida] anglica]|uniref:UDP-N-acetylglucosamine transporter Yea4p n=1 Tax=[Candida] anglica TaxID=148631 RepID=A0ABP0EGA5_9ASCO